MDHFENFMAFSVLQGKIVDIYSLHIDTEWKKAVSKVAVCMFVNQSIIGENEKQILTEFQ